MLEAEQTIGSYRVIRKLGAGGMGAVFEAVHQEIGRRAAIKVLHPHLAQDAQTAARFLNEARAASAIEHPGIVEIFEFNRLPDGTTYLVMELLRGESLASLLARRPMLPLSDVLRLVRQIASPLAAAHDKGIVHRDLKPDNVMIIPDPEAVRGTRIKVVDFGIAKLAGPGGAEDGHQITRTGAVMGTPAYMAPEQCRGAGQVDDRADVYSLGVMLYQCLSGRLPFLAAGPGEVMAMHLFTPLPSLHTLDPALPVELVHLVHGMLAKAPTDRPGMGRVVARLEQLGAGSASQPEGVLQPVAARGQRGTEPSGAPSTLRQAVAEVGARAQRQGTRGRAALYAGLATMVALVVGSGVYLYSGSGAQVPVAAPSPRREVTAPQQPAAPPAVPPPAPPMRVRWSITSVPAGAQVVRPEDGGVLGRTPWRDERPRAAGATTLLLRREGHTEAQLVLQNDRDQALTESLQPLQPAPVQVQQVRQPRPRRQRPLITRKQENYEETKVQILPD